MEDRERTDLEQAIGVAAGMASVANMGVVAICQELVAVGILDEKALGRISDSMVAAFGRSELPPHFQAVLIQTISAQFQQMQGRMNGI